MLESLAATLLSKYIGDYVTGFSRDNLSFSLLAGNAVLENLELKKEALDALNLPVTVKGGNILLFS
jgi:vacuolar protein sorting-associated protein 13A/C